MHRETNEKSFISHFSYQIKARNHVTNLLQMKAVDRDVSTQSRGQVRQKGPERPESILPPVNIPKFKFESLHVNFIFCQTSGVQKPEKLLFFNIEALPVNVCL